MASVAKFKEFGVLIAAILALLTLTIMAVSSGTCPDGFTDMGEQP